MIYVWHWVCVRVHLHRYVRLSKYTHEKLIYGCYICHYMCVRVYMYCNDKENAAKHLMSSLMSPEWDNCHLFLTRSMYNTLKDLYFWVFVHPWMGQGSSWRITIPIFYWFHGVVVIYAKPWIAPSGRFHL